jgi:hypothetical protein
MQGLTGPRLRSDSGGRADARAPRDRVGIVMRVLDTRIYRSWRLEVV